MEERPAGQGYLHKYGLTSGTDGVGCLNGENNPSREGAMVESGSALARRSCVPLISIVGEAAGKVLTRTNSQFKPKNGMSEMPVSVR